MLARPVRAIVLGFALLLAAPAVSSAERFCGTAKMTLVCPAFAAEPSLVGFCLDMEPGAGTGLLTTSAGTSMPVYTDWILDYKRAYFAASNAALGVGASVYSGTIKGTKLKGYVAEHTYGGCVSTGKMSGVLTP